MTRRPIRFADAKPAPGTLEDGAKALIELQPDPAPLSPFRLRAIRVRIDKQAERGAGVPWRTVCFAAAAAAAVVTTSVGFATPARIRSTAQRLMAVVMASIEEPQMLTVPERALREPARRSGAPSGARASAQAPLSFAPLVLAAEPPPAPHPAAHAKPTGLAREAASLREIAGLPPAEALARLRQFRRRFPSGALAAEADFAELRADAALGRDGEALGLVQSLESLDVRESELAVLHGELLAKRGDCAGALARWGQVIPESSDLAQRMLYGRAGCLAAVGNIGESRAAVSAYLRVFPRGRFAPALRSLADR